MDQSISCGGSCDQRVQTLQEAENVGKLENVFFSKLENVGFPDVIMSIQSIHCDSSDSSDFVTAAVDVWLRRDGGAS